METKIETTNKVERDSLVKRIFLASEETANAMKISYVLGVGLGATGRFTGAELIPVIPPVVDLFGGTLRPTPERIACYTAYGAGVATAYADKVYLAVTDIVDKL